MQNERPIICITGHRPNKLYGYNLSHKKYDELKKIFKMFLIEKNCKRAYSGMALGADIVFALAVLELKDEGFDIELCCAIPCLNHTSKWFNKVDIDRYNDILSKADVVTIVSNEEYKPYLMQVRNKYMVDNSDIVLSIWDGSAGGTKNCIDYAIKKGKKRFNINPNDSSLIIKEI